MDNKELTFDELYEKMKDKQVKFLTDRLNDK